MSTSYHIPEIEHYAGRNTDAHAMTDERGVTFYFSYRTLIAVRLPDRLTHPDAWKRYSAGQLFIRSNDWGPTTGKHLNAINRDLPRMNGNAFHDAVAEALACL